MSRLNWSTTFLTVVSLLAFLLVHDYDGKGALPLLMWAVIGLVAAPFDQKIPCLVLLASWFSLWLVAFKPGLQKNWLLLLCFLIPQWVSLLRSYNRYEQYGTIWPVTSANIWFWIPALVFVMASLLTVYKVFRLRPRRRAVQQV